MSALHLREALPGDAAAVNACVQAAYAAWVERIGRKPWPMLQDYALVIREQHVVIAEADGELAGVLVLAETDEGFLIDNVAVHPSKKGQGIGKALLVHAEQEAVARGYESVYLYTNEKMTENIAMYTRAGYLEYERRQEVGFRRVFLRKSLL
jgi:ribosomal protein S18 acetylase RimI-like enzyme